MKILRNIGLLLFLTSMLFACKDESQTAIGNLQVAEVSFSDLKYNAASLTAKISGNSSTYIVKSGFCYDTVPNVDIQKSLLAEATVENGTITAQLSNLSENKTYYVKSFVLQYNTSAIYSSEVSFTTPNKSGQEALNDYTAPTYADNYTSIASWSQRASWNLANVHDPSVMKADDGYYYMYQTDASYGNAHDGHGHFHARRSQDLVNWEYLGATMLNTPAWIKTKLNEIRAQQGLSAISNPVYGFWAPVARKVSSGKYRMYYSIVIDNYIKTGAASTEANFDNSWSERAFIGMMETSDPASNNWEDKGYVVCSSSDKGMSAWTRATYNGNWGDAYFKYNAIDPTYIITQSGEHWLIYGSWHSGIASLQVDPTTGMPLQTLGDPWNISEPSAYGRRVSTRHATYRWQGSEGPEIIYNPETDYYYIFVAYDGLDIPYNTRVSRSKNINGPYFGIDGVNVTAGGTMLPVVTHPYKFNGDIGWVGISHCAIFDDGDGNWFYASQARFPADVPGINASNAIMMGHIRSIKWTSTGWPVVMPERYGNVPKVAITESELIGTWENIDLSYQVGVQKTSETLTLNANHTVSAGIWDGKSWSFDEGSQTLTINGVELCLQREVDWEASPRKITIVFAGYTTTKTYWGKKS